MGELKLPEKLWPREPQRAISMPMHGAEETQLPASTTSCGLGQEQLNDNHEKLK